MTCNRDATLGLRVLSIQEVDSADTEFQLKIILFIWGIYIYVPFPITRKMWNFTWSGTLTFNCEKYAITHKTGYIIA